MTVLHPPKIVLLGMMTKIPVAGAVWGTLQYLIGLRRLGYDVYYVEAHARTPSMLMDSEDNDSSALAADFIDRHLRRFNFGDKWCFHALHDDNRCHGLSETQLHDLYRNAALLINYHGGTMPLAEHAATGRLIYLETDPVELEVELFNNVEGVIEFLKPHVAFFTWGLNYGHVDCRVPLPEQFHFRTTRPPVVLDLWEPQPTQPAEPFTTVGNWKQFGQVTYQGETYTWSKHVEFLKYLDLPGRTGQAFELGLSSYEPQDKALLESRGWKVTHALDFSKELDPYRDFLRRSRGEFTVAKDQNVRLRSGWFSERSVQYLAAGRPVVTQETGFSNVLPTGRGLFSFTSPDEAAAAIETVATDYPSHRLAAREVAHDCFAYDRVLRDFLSAVGV